MKTHTLVSDGSWEDVLALLPEGYEEAALRLGALRRRRQVRSAGDLLRLALAYSVCDLSLRLTAGWASLQGLAELSDVAVLKRLRSASDWLGWLVVRTVSEGEEFAGPPPWRVRIVDASGVSEPGIRGTGWRVHLGLDLVKETIQTVELTGPEGGETLTRHAIVPEEILVVDRGYAQRKGVAHVLEHQGHVVVRLNWKNFPLQDAQGRVMALPEALESLGVGESCDQDVWFEHEGRRYPVRLVAHRKTAEPTEREKEEIRHRAQWKKRRPDPRTLRAWCFVMLVTDLPREIAPADQVLALYRLRWRVEMAFKRLKSVLHLDHLRAHDPRLVSAYLHSKLLAAVLLDRLSGEDGTESLPPWGGAEARAPEGESFPSPAPAGGGIGTRDPSDRAAGECGGPAARPLASPGRRASSSATARAARLPLPQRNATLS